MSGPLDISFQKVHRLFEFFVLLSKGLHSFYQLAPLLGNPSYLLQMHNDSIVIQFQTSTRTFLDVVLTLIYFVTSVRAVSSLLNALVVSSSTITMSSPRFWRIRTDWGRGSSRMISSTSSSYVAAGGIGGRIAAPTMPSEASGSVVGSLSTARFSAPDSAVVEGAVADSFAVVDNRSLPPSPPGAAFVSPACCRALRDSWMGSTGFTPAPGPALGCCSV